MNKERAIVKNFIVKCRNYVNRSKLQGKIDGAEFALRMVEFMFSDSRYAWLAGVASSVSSLMGKKFAPIASDLYRILYAEITNSEANKRRAASQTLIQPGELAYAFL